MSGKHTQDIHSVKECQVKNTQVVFVKRVLKSVHSSYPVIGVYWNTKVLLLCINSVQELGAPVVISYKQLGCSQSINAKSNPYNSYST